MKKFILMTGMTTILTLGTINESLAAISCVSSDNGKTVTITGGGNDYYSNCNSSNSSSADSGWTFDSNYKKTITTANIGPGINGIGEGSFRDATNLSSVTISNGVTRIYDSAFNGASSLTSVTLPNTLTSIGNAAFYGASSLTSITIPNSVQSIGVQAFRGASSLESITIPESVTRIESQAFLGTSNLTTVNLPDTLTYIGTEAFENATNLTNITLPNGLLTIDASAFSDSGLSGSIRIPSTVTNIGSSAFFKCFDVTEIIIPDTLTAENVAGWDGQAFNSVYNASIRCVDSEGNDSTNESACVAALTRFFPDENGNCSVYTCLRAKKIGNTCVGKYFGSANNDGTCVTKSSCTGAGNYINTDTRQCMTPASCTGMYVADTVNKKCFKMPGCVNYADNACQECDSGYLKQSGACVEESACNGRNYASGDECKEMPEGCIGMSGDSCATCDGEHLEKDGSCISASAGCGAGYRQFENWCNRIQYTPAEAAPLLKDDDNFVIITFKK